MNYQLLQGDCREQMKTLADCSVDSIVTDPPYELGFMGKGWDKSGIAYDVSVWLECLRVLKPGGHLLAFGGSRTYHRLACAIEDAGFEIRDQIQYIYGGGFPKSLNVSKNLREQGSVCTCNDQRDAYRPEAQRKSKPLYEHGLRRVPDSDLSQSLRAETQSREVLQSRLSESDAPELWSTWAESEIAGPQQSSVEGRRDRAQKERKLHGRSVCASAEMGEADGAQGSIHHGASVSNGSDVRISSHENGSREPFGSQTVEQLTEQFRTMADERGSQAWGGWPICSRCRKPILPEGLGSALKPAHEPIVVARKPLVSTLIQNVLRHGTGALNVDGCRIQTVDNLNGGAHAEHGSERHDGAENWRYKIGGAGAFVQPEGRWPANVIHDGSDEVLAGFPETTSGNGNRRPNGGGDFFRGINPAVADFDGDSGSAARFFYCAKASKEDREEGLNDLAIRSAGSVTDRKDGSDGLNSPRAGAGRTNGARNHHPTVKPTDLMRYLCRLVTPPGGMVLDCFCGSGSTGKAAMLEGLSFIGIELSAEYCELAQRRIEAATRQGLLWATA